MTTRPNEPGDARAVNLVSAAARAVAPGRGRRIEQVDGLRALAALLVIWQHISEVYKTVASGGVWLSALADYVDFGRIGVCAFFAISGFVVPTSIRGPRLAAMVDFAERRFWRLYPAYWASIPLGLLAVWVIWGKPMSLSMLVANSTMIPSVWGEPFVMGHYWTLEVELLFYTLCALIYFVFGRINLAIGVAFVGLAFMAKRYGLFSGTPNHWPFAALDLTVMFWGCCCRYVYDGALPARLGKYRAALGYLLVAATLGVVLWEPIDLLWMGYARDLAGHRRLGWGYSIGVLLFLFWVLVARVRVRLLEWMGKATYSLYLLHAVVFYVAFKLVHTKTFAPLRDLHLGLYLLGLAPVCVVVGMLGYHLIERPSDILRRLLSAPARPQQEAAPAVAGSVRVVRPRRFSSGPRAARSLRLRSRGSRGKRKPRAGTLALRGPSS